MQHACFFDKSKAAFRAGYGDNTNWDEGEIGDYSVAFGFETKASASYSTAIGSLTTASGIRSTAMGYKTTASAERSTAFGNQTIASGKVSFAAGEVSTASGDVSTTFGAGTKADTYCSFAIGSYNIGGGSPAYADRQSTDPLFEIGNGTYTGRSNALTVLRNGNTEINGTLAVDSTLTIGEYTLPDTDGTSGQVLTTDGSGAVSWADAGGSGGAFSTTTNVTSNAGGDLTNDDFVFGSGSLNYDNNTDHAARMFFDKSKRAFRAGYANTTNWDEGNIGATSVALGNNPTASGSNSTAIGYEVTASGEYSTATGYKTTASGNYSTAIGSQTTASGVYSTAMGYAAKAESSTSFAIGKNNVGGGNAGSWITTDPLFEIGNGASAVSLSNAFTVYKNGNVEHAGTITQTSDERLKTNITPLGSVLDKINRINPVTFEFKDSQTHPSGTLIGFIAQNVQAEFPELVATGMNGYLSLSYANMTAVNMQAVKELNSQAQSLRTENTELKNKVESMESLLQQIQQRLEKLENK